MCPPEQFDPRHTFLRRHVERVRARNVQNDDGTPIHALRDLREYGMPVSQLTLAWFLENLYQPTGLSQVNRNPVRYEGLVDLLLHEPGPSIVTLSGGGCAGKSVELLHAFFACPPGLPGTTALPYLPCWIGQLPPNDNYDWPRLIKTQAGIDCTVGQVRAWVRTGPPVLVLCELDRFPLDRQQYLCQTLQQFIDNEGPRARVVIAHRSASAPRLTNPLRFRLDRWNSATTGAYLDSWGRLTTGTKAPRIHGEFREIIRRQARLPGQVRLLSGIAGEPYPRSEGQMIERWVLHAAEQVAGLVSQTNHQLTHLLAWTARLAMACFHGAEERHNLAYREAEGYLRRPDQHREQIVPAPHNESLWNVADSHYFTNQNATAESRALVLDRTPFLERRDNQLYFVNDTHHYFEGGMATRYWHDPGMPHQFPQAELVPWACAVLARWGRDPKRFCVAAQLLGGVLPIEVACALVRCYITGWIRNGEQEQLHEVMRHLLAGAAQHLDDPIIQSLVDGFEKRFAKEEMLTQLVTWFEERDSGHLAAFQQLMVPLEATP